MTFEKTIEERSSRVRRRTAGAATLILDKPVETPAEEVKLDLFTPYQVKTPTNIGKHASDIVAEKIAQEVKTIPEPVKAAPKVEKEFSSEFENMINLNKTAKKETFETEIETAYESEAAASAINISMRGKLVMVVAAATLFLLTLLMFINIARISSVNSDIGAMGARVNNAQNTFNIVHEYHNGIMGGVGSSQHLQNIAMGMGLGPSTVNYFNPANPSNPTVNASGNWFDNMIRFFQNLFS